MILTHSVKVCLAIEPCDLRKSFDSLSVIVREQLGDDPLSRTVFVFINKARNRIKLLYFDGTGLWVMAKRLVAHCSHLLFSEDPLSIPPAVW